MKRTKEEIKLLKNPINEFTCCDKAMTHKDFMVHLKEAHKLDMKGMKAKKQMMMHMDGDFWFSYQWQWELETGLKFTQFTKQVRADDDMMRF